MSPAGSGVSRRILWRKALARGDGGLFGRELKNAAGPLRARRRRDQRLVAGQQQPATVDWRPATGDWNLQRATSLRRPAPACAGGRA
jgi:hypothetical protein